MSKKLQKIKCIILDVDGTLTDTGIYYDNEKNELKRFSSRDGEAIRLARSLGIKIIVITGRKCIATERRIRELEIELATNMNTYFRIWNATPFKEMNWVILEMILMI